MSAEELTANGSAGSATIASTSKNSSNSTPVEQRQCLIQAPEQTSSQIILPDEFLKCSRTALVVLISRMLSSLIQMNDSMCKDKNLELTRFHSRVPPGISVYNYLIRLAKYSSLEPAVLIAAVYYIDLLSSVYPSFTLNSLTVHRFLLTATTVASKGLSDSFCTNVHYAKVGGVQCSELNVLETEFLKRVNYRIIPRDDNIFNCKEEYQQGVFITFPLADQIRGPNDGFNVLDTYYKKMIQLVGPSNSSPDKTSKVSYVLEPSEQQESQTRKRHYGQVHEDKQLNSTDIENRKKHSNLQRQRTGTSPREIL